MLKGDIDRFYRALRRAHPQPPLGQLAHLDHVRAISSYYAQLPLSERRLLLAWAKKEESGIGVIPTILSGVPLLGLLFAPLIVSHYKHIAPSMWVVLWAMSAIIFSAGVYIHHRQKAYTTLHILLLEHLCTISGDQPVAQPKSPSEFPLEAAGQAPLN